MSDDLFRIYAMLILWVASLSGTVCGQSVPAVNTVSLSQVDRAAPEKCWAYFSWTGWNDFDPERSLTEKWLAQPEMKASFDRLRSELRKVAQENLPEEDAERLELAVEMGLNLVQHPASICLHEIDIEKGTLAACLISHMGQEPATATLTQLRSWLKEASDMELFQETIGDVSYDAIRIPDGPSVYLGVEAGCLVLAIDRTAVEKWQTDRQTDEPQWLQELKQRYSISHLTAVAIINLHEIQPLISRSMDPETRGYWDELGGSQWQQLSVTVGVAPRGAIMRGGLKIEQPMRGVWKLLQPADPLQVADLAGINPRSDQIHVLQLPITEAVSFVRKMALESQWEDPTQEPIAQVLTETGIDLEAWLGSLSGRVIAYGALTMPFPQRGWVVSLGIRDSDAWDRQFQKLLEYVSQRPEVTVETYDYQGRTIYEVTRGESAFISPADDQVLFSFNRRAITQYWKRLEQAEAGELEGAVGFAAPYGSFFQEPIFGERRFLVASMIDYRPYIQMAIPALSLIFSENLPGTNLSMSDFPSVTALTNYLEPSLSAVFQTDDGYEFYYQQTAPFLSPGISTPVIVGGLLPAVQAARMAARRAASQNNLLQIGRALIKFKQEHGQYPARYSTNSDGQPLLSWRVHLLPYLGQEALYEQFHLEEPWNSPHNLALQTSMPDIFLNPSLPETETETSYLVIEAEGLLGPPSPDSTFQRPLTAAENPQDDSKPLTLVMESQIQVPWTAPVDFQATWADQPLSAEMLHGVNAVDSQGKVNFYPDTELESLRSQWQNP